MLHCTSEQCIKAHAKALNAFWNDLTHYHTPAPMVNCIMTAIKQWFQDLQQDILP